MPMLRPGRLPLMRLPGLLTRYFLRVILMFAKSFSPPYRTSSPNASWTAM
jgi:hypothetical protein